MNGIQYCNNKSYWTLKIDSDERNRKQCQPNPIRSWTNIDDGRIPVPCKASYFWRKKYKDLVREETKINAWSLLMRWAWPEMRNRPSVVIRSAWLISSTISLTNLFDFIQDDKVLSSQKRKQDAYLGTVISSSTSLPYIDMVSLSGRPNISPSSPEGDLPSWNRKRMVNKWGHKNRNQLRESK